jgi:multidrug efflux pump subunit AcrA (membrane-fusion protein)
MPLSDILAAALSRPAARVVEGPVRNIVNEVLQDHGYASPAEVQALRDQVASAGARLGKLEAQLGAVETAAAGVQAQLDAMSTALQAAQTAAAAAQARAAAAEAHSSNMDLRVAALEAGATSNTPTAAPVALATDPLAHLDRQQRHLFRAGRLPGHVGPEGLIDIDGKAYRLDESLAGRPFEVAKTKKLQVLVDGNKLVPSAI